VEQRAGVRFVGEQDGPPERELKSRLKHYFQPLKAVERAYLAHVAYADCNELAVALCLRTRRTARDVIVRGIASLFADIFGRDQHLDIIFLDRQQEAELEPICAQFFP